MGYTNYNVRQVPFAIRYVSDLIRFRHLCWNLAGSDLRSRFRRSRLGIVWATIQPLAFSLMIAFVWGSIFQAPNYLSFAAYVFSGMLVWEYFSTTTLGALDALVNANGYLKQQRIPFFIFQLRGPLVSTVIFVAGFVGLVILLALIGELPTFGYHLLLVPAALGMAFLFVLPLSILFSVAGTQFRDLRYITMLLLQAMFFLTPVMLARSYLEKPPLDILNFINPAVPLINLFREPMLYGHFWDPRDVIVLTIWTVGLWVAAIAASVIFGRRVIFAL
jgi:lipopolysaccharide transport system permease protein